MQYLPIFINLAKIHCLIIGSGRVALRKAEYLINAKSVTIIDPNGFSEDWKKHNYILLKKDFAFSDLQGVNLVFATSSNHKLNTIVANECHNLNIFCNIADFTELSNFIVPSIRNKGNITLAVSSSGLSPALTKNIANKLEIENEAAYNKQIELLGLMRKDIIIHGRSEENAQIFRALASLEVTDCFIQNDANKLLEIINSILPKRLHSKAERIVYELFRS